MQADDTKMDLANRRKGIRWVLSCIRPSWGYYLPGLLFSATGNLVLGYIPARYVKDVFDIILGDQRAGIGLPMLRFVVASVASSIVQVAGRLLMSASVSKTSHIMRCRLFEHLQHLPSRFYDRHHSGVVSSHFMNDLEALQSLYSGSVVDIVSQIATIIGSFTLVFAWDWRLGIGYAILALSSFVASRRLLMKVERYPSEILASASRVTQRLLDLLAGMRELRVYRLGEVVLGKFKRANQENEEWSLREITTSAWLGGLNGLWQTGSFVGLVAAGFVLARQGLSTIGTVLGCALFVSGFIWMYRAITMRFSEFAGGLAAGTRIAAVLDLPREADEKSAYDRKAPQAWPGLPDDPNRILEVRNLTFGYNEEQAAVDGVSFKAAPGEVLGIVGESGSGKSTLMKILAGLYVPRSGGMHLNGRSDVRSHDASCRPQVFLDRFRGFDDRLAQRQDR